MPPSAPSQKMPPSAPSPVLGAIGSSAVPELRALLDDALPVKYPDAFYRSVPNMPRSLARGAYVERRLIGAVVCFVRAAESTAGWIRADADERLVVSMLAVRPDHRGRGVASALLRAVIETAVATPSVGAVELHVQTSNATALSFYKGHGFVLLVRKPDFYDGIDPPHAYQLRLVLAATSTTRASRTRRQIAQLFGEVFELDWLTKLVIVVVVSAGYSAALVFLRL